MMISPSGPIIYFIDKDTVDAESAKPDLSQPLVTDTSPSYAAADML